MSIILVNIQREDRGERLPRCARSLRASRMCVISIPDLATIEEAVGPDQKGVVASANISQSLSNLNAATANMADDTEALKHNFLVRGFFRHRGYYNLSHINPDQYN